MGRVDPVTVTGEAFDISNSDVRSLGGGVVRVFSEQGTSRLSFIICRNYRL
jgi:hypothetical protein